MKISLDIPKIHLLSLLFEPNRADIICPSLSTSTSRFSIFIIIHNYLPFLAISPTLLCPFLRTQSRRHQRIFVLDFNLQALAASPLFSNPAISRTLRPDDAAEIVQYLAAAGYAEYLPGDSHK